MGVPMDDLADIFNDNQSVVLTAQKPETRLSKKHNAVNYHHIRYATAGKWIRVAFKSGASKLADFLTEILSFGKRIDIIWKLTQKNGGRMSVLWLNLRRGRKPMKDKPLLITRMRIDPVGMNGSPHGL